MREQPGPGSSVRVLHGVGDTRAKALEAAGIVTVLDVARHFPRAYQDRGDLRRLSDGRDGQKMLILFLPSALVSPYRLLIKRKWTVKS